MSKVLVFALLFHVFAFVRSQGNDTTAPAIIFANSSASVVTVREGATAVFECYAGGNPAPNISWHSSLGNYLPTHENFHEGSVYKIEHVRREAQLNGFVCTAENGIGEKAVRKFALRVSFKPDAYVLKGLVHEAIGYDVYFYCFVLAYPWPKVVWMKNGEPIANDSHITVTESRTGAFYTTLTIDIKKVEEKHFGTYVCKGENELGSGAVEMNLRKVDKHECPPVCPDPPIILNAPESKSSTLDSGES